MPKPGVLVRTMLGLRTQERTGLLRIRVADTETFVYLKSGVPIFAEEGSAGETLGRLLLRQQRLTQEQYLEVLSKMTDALFFNEQIRFGETAVELGYLTETQVDAALRDQVRWKIVRCFQSDEATWTFEDNPVVVEDVGDFRMSIEGLVLDAVLWLDGEKRAALGLADAMDKYLSIAAATRAELLAELHDEPGLDTFLARADGRTRTRDLIAGAGGALDGEAIVTALLMLGAGRLSVDPHVETIVAARPQAAPTETEPRPFARPDSPPAAPKPFALPPAPIATAPIASPAAPRAPIAAPAPAPAPVAAAASAAAAPAAPTPAFAAPTAQITPPTPPVSIPLPAPGPPRPPIRPRSPSPFAGKRPGGGSVDRRRTSEVMARIREEPPPSRADADLARKPSSPHEASLLAEQAFQRGRAHLEAERTAQAAAAFRRALELAPNQPEFALLALWCDTRGRVWADEDAADTLKKRAAMAVNRDPNLAFGWHILGYLAFAAQDLERAKKLFQRALKLDPELKDAQRHLRLTQTRIDAAKTKK